MHIDQLHEGQEVIACYHDHGGRIVNTEAVRFVRADLEPPLMATATLLRQDDAGVWIPFTIHRFAGEWAYWKYAPGYRRFSVRPVDKFTAGAVAIDIDSDRPSNVLEWMATRLGYEVTEDTELTEMTAEALHLEWQAATLMLR